MTAVTTLLAGIKAQSDGLTDLCPGYLRQGIRHLQRNCDVECSAHEEDGTWLDCNQPGRYDGDRMAEALASIPRLVAALEAVEDLAKVWNAKGEHDMVYSKTIPDEDIAMELLTHGADMVEKARILRAAVVAALGGGE